MTTAASAPVLANEARPTVNSAAGSTAPAHAVISSIMSPNSRPAPHGRVLGRYLIFGEIGSGGSATVHFGRLRGPAGFGRTVALKRLHGHLAADPQHVTQFLAEARLTARIHHPNVVPLLDVIALPDGELLLVMDYVHGETLGGLLGAARRRATPIPVAVTSAIMTGVLLGLHAAHETVGESGSPLGLVHGDVSPHNIIVGADGSARVLDFGIARVAGTTIDKKRVMGTPAYMAPERFRDAPFDLRSDLFGAAVVLWEMLTLERLFRGQGEPQSADRAVRPILPPSRKNPSVPPALDAVVLRALKARPEDRYATALAFARALEIAAPPATSREVSEWVTASCGQRLRERGSELARIEAVTTPDLVAPNDLRKDRTGDEDGMAFSLLDVDEPPAPSPRVGQTRPGFSAGVPVLAPQPVPAPLLRQPADDEPTTVEAGLDPRMLEAMLAPPLVGQTLPARFAVNPAEAPTTVESSTTAATTALTDRRFPAATPQAPFPPAASAPRSIAASPSADRAPVVVDRPALDRALMDRGRETPTRPMRVAGRTGYHDLGAIEQAVHRGSFDGTSDPAMMAAHAGDLAELVRASRTPRLIALCAMASISVMAVSLVVRASMSPSPDLPMAAVADSEPPSTLSPSARAPRAPSLAADLAARADQQPPLPAQPAAIAVERAAAPTAAEPAPEAEPTGDSEAAPETVPAATAIARQVDAPRARDLRRPLRPRTRALADARGPRSNLLDLNRRAMAAYERLELEESLELLRQGLRLGGSTSVGNRDALALTHLNMGVVLAGGFKQRGLAVKHFRLARSLRSQLAPSPRLISPEVAAAFRQAVGRP